MRVCSATVLLHVFTERQVVLDSISLPSLVSYHSCWYNNAYCKRNTHNAYQRCITWKEASYYLSEEGIIRECPATSCALTSNQYWAAHKIPSRKRHVWSTLAERNFPGFSAGHFQSIDNWLEATRRDVSTHAADRHILPKGRRDPITNPCFIASCQTCLLTKLHRHYGNIQTTIELTVWAASQNEDNRYACQNNWIVTTRRKQYDMRAIWEVELLRVATSAPLHHFLSSMYIRYHVVCRCWSVKSRHRPLMISGKRDTILAWAKDMVPNLQEAMRKFIRPSATFVSVNNCEYIWCIGTTCRLVIEWRV